jgi:hypothetical protein
MKAGMSNEVKLKIKVAFCRYPRIPSALCSCPVCPIIKISTKNTNPNNNPLYRFNFIAYFTIFIFLMP